MPMTANCDDLCFMDELKFFNNKKITDKKFSKLKNKIIKYARPISPIIKISFMKK